MAGGVLAVGLFASSVLHASPIASGQNIRDFTRITFEWSQPTTLTAKMEGNRLVITFDRRASAPDFSRLLTRLPKIVRSASLGEDGRTVTLVLDKPYRTRQFVSGSLAGVDLLGGSPPAAAPEPPKVPAKKPQPEKKPVPPKVAVPKPVPVVKPISPPVVKAAPPAPVEPPKVVAPVKPTAEVVAPAPAPAEAVKPPAPETAAKPETPAPLPAPTEKTPEKEAPAASEAPVTAKPETPPPSEAPAAAPPAKPESSAEPTVPAPAVEPAPPPAVAQRISLLPAANAPTLKMEAQVNGDQTRLRFPWAERTALAAFMRGDTAWLVFDRPAALNADAAKQVGTIQSIEQLVAPNATVLRIGAKGMQGLRVQRAPESQGWDVVLSPRPQPLTETLIVQPKTDTPLKPYLLINALETAPALTLKDPVVGDMLSVVPDYAAGQGTAPGRDYVEMEQLPTAQGLAFASHGPELSVVSQRNGLRVSTAEGLHLSPGLPTVPNAEPQAETPRTSLFAQFEMEPEHGQSLRQMESELLPLMLKPGALANEARFRLAQAYLSQGLDAEAIGMLEQMRDASMDAFIRDRASAYSGLANFLMNRHAEAARDFGAPELLGNEEMDVWRTILADLTGQSDASFDYPRFNARYAKQYPLIVRRRLGLMAIDRMIGLNRYNDALAVLDQMKKDKLDKGDKPTEHALTFFNGDILVHTGYAAKGEELWKGLAGEVGDRYWRARANYALINLNLARKTMTPEEAIPKLDALRIQWRDDAFELQVLKQLGALQSDAKQYREALRTWKEITTAYPNTEDAFKAAQQMADSFVMLFNEGGAKDMKPLEALTLYYEFKELTPIEAGGDQMIQNLADRLAEVDLLDRAAALLEHQVKFRLSGEERSRVGARLALIYLLDRKPQPALDVLERTGFGANGAELQQKRDLLTARALADLKEGDRAIKLLEDDTSPEAAQLKLDVYWDRGDWKQVVATGEAMLSQRADPAKPLTESEMGALLKLAVAYSFERDTDQLHYLRDYFGPLTQASPHKDLFAFLTNDTPVSPQSIAELAGSITQMQTFLSNWRTEVKEKGLSEAVK